MRSNSFLLDTNILLYLLNKTGDISKDVEAIISDYGNTLFMCAASVRELVGAWHKYSNMQREWKSPRIALDYLKENYGIAILYPHREHYEVFLNLEWNVAENHRDTTDLLIISHAITEKIPLISSDRKFHFYREQGLDFIYNKR